MSASNLRAVLAADTQLGAGNVLLRLAEHGAGLDVPRVTFDTDVDSIAEAIARTLGDHGRRPRGPDHVVQHHGGPAPGAH